MLGVHWCSECYLPRACCCALRRAAFGETLEYSNDLGLYPRVGLGLHTRGYASVRGSAVRGRRLRARVRKSRRVCVQKNEPLAARYSGVLWS